jgi:MFS family permease
LAWCQQQEIPTLLTYWRTLRAFNRSILLYLAVWGLAGFAYFGILGVLLNLYLLRLGFDPEFIGVLIGSGQLVWAIFALPAGAIGARIGVRNALIGALALTSFGLGLFLLVEALPPTMWKGWLLGWWMLVWVGVSLFTVNGIPYLMSITRPEERNHAFSVQAALIGLLAFVGSIIAGQLPGLFARWTDTTLAHAAPYRYALWLVPGAYLIGLLAMLGTRSAKMDTPTAARTHSSAAPIGLFVFFGLITFLQAASEGAIRAFFNLYLDVGLRLSTEQIGTVMGLGQLLPVFVVLATPLFLARWGTKFTLTVATFALTAFLVPLAAIPHWAAASIGFVGMGATIGVLGTTRNIFSQEIVLPQWRTTTSAIATIGLALGWASTSGIGGYVIARLSYSGLFFIGAASAFAAAILLWNNLRLQSVNVNPVPVASTISADGS